MAALFAYVDPASGMLLLQLIIAGAVGTVAFFRRSILGLFRGLFGGAQDAPGEDEQSEEAAEEEEVEQQSSSQDKAEIG